MRELLASQSTPSVAVDLVDEIVTVVLKCVANLVGSDDLDIFNLCLMRLLNVAIPMALRVETTFQKANLLMSIWRQIFEASTLIEPIMSESLNLLTALLAPDLAHQHMLFVLQHFTLVIESRRSYSFESILNFVSSLSKVVAVYTAISMKVAAL